jgi:hypothetical protein
MEGKFLIILKQVAMKLITGYKLGWRDWAE